MAVVLRLGLPVGQARGRGSCRSSRKRTTVVSKSPTSARFEPRWQLLPGPGWSISTHPELTGGLAGIAAEQLEQFRVRMREGLLAASVAVGLGVLGEFLAAEVTEKAVPKGRHDPQRTASRHGSERATVPLGGRRVPVDKPRLRA